ncbi:MAG: nuclear transport factor 2 family protein [Pyrinomonadaceae bacterium]
MNTRRISLIISLTAVLCASVAAQSAAPKPADPKDVGSLDSIMKAVYDVISGDAGKERDWDRFRSLFHADARLIPVGKNAQTGVFGVTTYSPDDYAKRAAPGFAANGFHERELARHVDIYGNIAQVFSTYHAFRKSDDKTPFLRGINSFQLLNDGKRWWVLTIYWQAETPDNAIPAKYLKTQE